MPTLIPVGNDVQDIQMIYTQAYSMTLHLLILKTDLTENKGVRMELKRNANIKLAKWFVLITGVLLSGM